MRRWRTAPFGRDEARRVDGIAELAALIGPDRAGLDPETLDAVGAADLVPADEPFPRRATDDKQVRVGGHNRREGRLVVGGVPIIEAEKRAPHAFGFLQLIPPCHEAAGSILRLLVRIGSGVLWVWLRPLVRSGEAWLRRIMAGSETRREGISSYEWMWAMRPCGIRGYRDFARERTTWGRSVSPSGLASTSVASRFALGLSSNDACYRSMRQAGDLPRRSGPDPDESRLHHKDWIGVRRYCREAISFPFPPT